MAGALAAAAPAWTGTERSLTFDETGRHIRRAGWAVLSVLDGKRPYAVPLAYGFDGRRFFVACAPGRKRRALEAQPKVCLTIVDAPGESGSGGYVNVLGTAAPVRSIFARARAGLLILRRFSRGGVPTFRDLRRMMRGQVFRIEPHEVSGRAPA